MAGAVYQQNIKNQKEAFPEYAYHDGSITS